MTACVSVITKNNRIETLRAKHAILTFSIGVLQNKQGYPFFHPALPANKMKAINSIKIAHFLKLFVKLNSTFWDKKSTLAKPLEST